MGVWNSSRQTEHDIIPVFRLRSLQTRRSNDTFRCFTCKPGRIESQQITHILTSQDFSWLQKGHVNWVSRSPVIFFLGGAFLLDLRRPIVHRLWRSNKDDGEYKSVETAMLTLISHEATVSMFTFGKPKVQTCEQRQPNIIKMPGHGFEISLAPTYISKKSDD